MSTLERCNFKTTMKTNSTYLHIYICISW